MSEKTKSNIFWSIFILLLLSSIFFTYKRVFINKDYMVVTEVSCDPELESCFVYTPEDLCLESEEVDCLENTESEYYKIINKKAAHVPVCNSESLKEGETCPELTCEIGENSDECYYENKD